MEKQKNNRVVIEGEITSEFELEWEFHGEGFYKVYLAIPRINGDKWDYIPCLVSDRLVDVKLNMVGSIVRIKGEIRTHNKDYKLQVNVFAQDVEFLDDYTSYGRCNKVVLHGFLCKQPVYRKTPLGREIADMVFAVNRQYNKSDYIPCICWGRNARFASELYVGDEMALVGRIQSREYLKNGETRIAYEVSVNRIEFAWDDEKFREILQESMNWEADRIMEKVNADPSLKDVVAPEEIHDKLMEEIKKL